MGSAEPWEASREGELWYWADSSGAVEVRFAGKLGSVPRTEDEGVLKSLVPGGVDLARLEQAHSATVVAAKPGLSGRGDALVTTSEGLALCIVTADCVPVVLAAGHEIAAVHAGWRGVAGRVLPATLRRLRSRPVRAWIGPAIGPCCYEVGEDVAERVCSSCTDGVVRPARHGSSERPHLDLVAAATSQLREFGVSEVRTVDVCTRCQPERLWSYRRDGASCGRNLALIWRKAQASGATS